MNIISKNDFLYLIKDNQGIILSVCNMYYNNSEDIQDAKQEVILQLWKSRYAFKNECKVSTWIYKVTINTILSLKRKERKQLNKEPISEFNFNRSTSYNYFDDPVLQLKQIINLLKDDDKAFVILFLEGYSHKEIAKILNTNISNVSTRLSRIRNRIKKLYKIIQNEY